jgi:hypothetical protein
MRKKRCNYFSSFNFFLFDIMNIVIVQQVLRIMQRRAAVFDTDGHPHGADDVD